MIEPLVQVGIPVVFYALPFLLFYAAWQLWIRYVRTKYINATKFILLEIKIPKEVTKTPQAMELALGALHQGWDGDNFIKQWFLGQCRTWFSLEMVSLGGEVHFYIWTSAFFRNLIEAQFYAQYPGIEIHEVEDYVHNIPYGLPDSDWKLWGAEFKLSKDDAYPIKTYVNYGLDKPTADSDEGAARTDPITAVLEFLGSMNPGEQLWLQIMVQASKDRYHKPGTLWGREGWKDRGKALREKLMQRDKKHGPEESGIVVLSPGERKALEDVERSLTKPGFDCGIRAIYLAKPDVFSPLRIVSTVGMLKQYNSADLNGFRPSWTTGEKYPWSKFISGYSLSQKKAGLFNAYRLRSYFYPPYAGQPFVLSTEELATIYHFPGSVAMTPSLSKISSKRAEPPSNLPI
ncbi:hypothetical protein IT398_00875 [Candidatus Nomurabacteria bacterium]|nr:hypothetical protein [Candidatus Nomurabacteria bacterium]